MNTLTSISSVCTKEDKDKDSYSVYVVFELPYNSTSDTPLVADESFLSQCLHEIQERNDINIHDSVARSPDYFTSLNHSERTRIPKAIRRLNISDSSTFYGILSFQAFRHESVKNKSFNQRVTSINPDILIFERLQALFVPLNYPYDLSQLGHPITHEPAGFIQVILLPHRFIQH